MTKYIVEVDKLTHSKFGILTRGSKFNAEPSEVSELVKDKSIKAFRGKTSKVEEREVSDAPVEVELENTKDTGETVEVSKSSKKKGKK